VIYKGSGCSNFDNHENAPSQVILPSQLQIWWALWMKRSILSLQVYVYSDQFFASAEFLTFSAPVDVPWAT
jgi:hypothetical protein